MTTKTATGLTVDLTKKAMDRFKSALYRADNLGVEVVMYSDGEGKGVKVPTDRLNQFLKAFAKLVTVTEQVLTPKAAKTVTKTKKKKKKVTSRKK